jgi:hypothetical protein
MHALILTLLLTGHTSPETASGRAWARVSPIAAEVHALVHHVHGFLPNDGGWTAEDDATLSTALALRGKLQKLALDCAVAGRRHTERHPRTTTSPDTELTRLRLVELLSGTLVTQLDILHMATLDKPDARWRTFLPPACALTESILQEWRETGNETMPGDRPMKRDRLPQLRELAERAHEEGRAAFRGGMRPQDTRRLNPYNEGKDGFFHRTWLRGYDEAWKESLE